MVCGFKIYPNNKGEGFRFNSQYLDPAFQSTPNNIEKRARKKEVKSKFDLNQFSTKKSRGYFKNKHVIARNTKRNRQSDYNFLSNINLKKQC